MVLHPFSTNSTAVPVRHGCHTGLQPICPELRRFISHLRRLLDNTRCLRSAVHGTTTATTAAAAASRTAHHDRVDQYRTSDGWVLCQVRACRQHCLRPARHRGLHPAYRQSRRVFSLHHPKHALMWCGRYYGQPPTGYSAAGYTSSPQQQPYYSNAGQYQGYPVRAGPVTFLPLTRSHCRNHNAAFLRCGSGMQGKTCVTSDLVKLEWLQHALEDEQRIALWWSSNHIDCIIDAEPMSASSPLRPHQKDPCDV